MAKIVIEFSNNVLKNIADIEFESALGRQLINSIRRGHIVRPISKSTIEHVQDLAGDYKCWDSRLSHSESLEISRMFDTITR